MDWAGSQRPSTYGDVEQEYWAVRRHVTVMDVSTLGKYRVAGPDATALLESTSIPVTSATSVVAQPVYAAVERDRYLFDDGMVCKLGDGSYYVTFTRAAAMAPSRGCASGHDGGSG